MFGFKFEVPYINTLAIIMRFMSYAFLYCTIFNSELVPNFVSPVEYVTGCNPASFVVKTPLPPTGKPIVDI